MKAKEQFEKAFEKVQVELAEEQRARKALQRDLSCHPESTDYVSYLVTTLLLHVVLDLTGCHRIIEGTDKRTGKKWGH